MPDWSYQTVLRPLLTRLPRRPVLAVLRAFGRSAAAGPLVRFFGHMEPPPSMRRRLDGLEVAVPVGLGAGLSPGLVPLASRFGVGFVEVGAGLSPEDLHALPRRVPVGLRVTEGETDRPRLDAVRPDFLTIEPSGRATGDLAADLPAWLVVRGAVRPAARRAQEAGMSGLWLEGPTAEALGQARAAWPDGAHVAAGVADPAQARRAFEHGAAAVVVDGGITTSGPGLPKRIQESLRAGTVPARRPGAWLGSVFLGLGLVVTGLLAWAVAATRVLLPYDEAFIGMSRSGLDALNPRLLDFLAHDRIAFAATAVATGILYAALAWNAQARGEHWARVTIRASAVVGFASFFLFLGFGYVDPLHAVVWALLFVVFLVGTLHRTSAPPAVPVPDRDDRAWRTALWGQLCFVVLAFGLIAGGLAIAFVGVTDVFVATDLAFLGTSREALDAADPDLVPVIAHDRAGFGGALASNGAALLLVALWGWRRGQAWLWDALAAAGAVGLAGSIGVHWTIGYTDAMHLAPVYLAMILYTAGLALGWRYLRGSAGLGA